VAIGGLLAGVGFGFLISWGRLTDPDVIRRMLSLDEGYVFLMMGSVVAVGFVGVRLLRRAGRRAILTGEPVTVRTEAPQRRHVVGSVVFGLGWAVACTCPGPVTAQLGQSYVWGLFTAPGIVGGVLLFFAGRGRAERQGGAAPASAHGPVSPVIRAADS
jgi:uncharacterized membrane protein YedE/YeeE